MKKLFFKKMIVTVHFPFIGILHFDSSPSAVIRSIVSVIIDTVNRCFFYPMNRAMNKVVPIHVFFKIQKVIPSFTHLYSPSAIVRKLGRIRVEASLSNSYPALMESGSSHTMTMIRALFGCTSIDSARHNFMLT